MHLNFGKGEGRGEVVTSGIEKKKSGLGSVDDDYVVVFGRYRRED